MATASENRPELMSEALEAIREFKPNNTKIGLPMDIGYKFMLIRHKVLFKGRENKHLFFVQCVDGRLGYIPKEFVRLSDKRHPVIKPSLLYYAIGPFLSQSPGIELNVETGMAIRILDSTPNGWVQGITPHQKGWFSSHVLRESPLPSFQFVVRVTESYTRRSENELTIAKGQKLDVIERPTPRTLNWLVRNHTGEIGTVHHQFLQEDLADNKTVLSELDWYHHFDSRSDSEKLLLSHPAETFLVRDSESSHGNFSIDIKPCGDNSIIHIRVEVSRMGYKLETENVYIRALDQLISKYHDKPIYFDEFGGFELKLKYPLKKENKKTMQSCQII